MKKKHKYFADDKAPMNSVVKEFKYQPNYTNMAYFKPPKGVNSSQHHFPTYKCPVCNRAFLLNQLFISDVLNYFVKTTPMDIDRIELRDMVKYRIVDEKEMVKEVPQENVVVLSDDDNSDDNETTTQIDDKQRSKSSSGHDGPWGSSLNDPLIQIKILLDQMTAFYCPITDIKNKHKASIQVPHQITYWNLLK